MDGCTYFSEQCFSIQLAPLFNSKKELMGYLNLRHFSQAIISISNSESQLICSGKFHKATNKWLISTPLEVIGEVRQKNLLFKHKFEYTSYSEGIVEVIIHEDTQKYQL